MKLTHILVTIVALALSVCAPAHAQMTGPIYCSQSASLDVAAGTNRILIAGSSPIFICGMDVSNSAAGTIQIKTGTGSNCGTGTANVTPAFSFVAGPSKFGWGNFVGLGVGATGLDICMTTTGAANTQIEIYFARQ